jgi:glutamate synthase (NADPH/NADH) large chain
MSDSSPYPQAPRLGDSANARLSDRLSSSLSSQRLSSPGPSAQERAPSASRHGVPDAQGLYDPTHEHDACGVGFVAHIKGKKSHAIVEQGLLILKNLTHRGAVGADPKASDGAGVLIQIPDAFFREEMAKQGIELPDPGEYGVGFCFLPREPASRYACEREIERAIWAEGQVLLGWRDVPVDSSMLGESVKPIEPVIRQVFIGRGAGVTVTGHRPKITSR